MLGAPVRVEGTLFALPRKTSHLPMRFDLPGHAVEEQQ